MLSMQAESLLSTNPVLLHKPIANAASENVARFTSVADLACSRVQRGQPRTAGRSGELSCRPNPPTVQIPYAQPAIVELAGLLGVRVPGEPPRGDDAAQVADDLHQNRVGVRATGLHGRTPTL